MREQPLLIFDYDGTLVDSLDYNLTVVARVCRQIDHFRFPTAQDVENLENVSFEDIAKEIDLPENKISQLTRGVGDALKRDPGDLQPFAGIVKLVHALHAAGAHLAIITTNFIDAILPFLTKTNMAHCFNDILDNDMPGAKADKIKGLARRLKIADAHVFMIGDAASDIRQGQTAGVHTIGVTWGYQSRAKIVTAAPDAIADHPQQVYTCLHAIGNHE